MCKIFIQYLFALIALAQGQDVGNYVPEVKTSQGILAVKLDLPKPFDFPTWLQDLGLSYTSTTRNVGITGYGWSIGGISKIWRYQFCCFF